jgi:hypothetical protein
MKGFQLSPFVGVALMAVLLSSPADADDEFDINVSKGQVTVTAKGDWHINAEYPWSLAVGPAKLDKSKFDLSEKKAAVKDVPSGKGTLRGAVCTGGRCRSLVRDVTIP